MEDKLIKVKIISGSSLKIIAVICMLVDHTAGHLFHHCAWALVPWFTIGKYAVGPFFVMRSIIGRWAFPIFAFLVVEGYLHTRSKKRYFLNLFLFALLTEPIWDLSHYDCLFSMKSQNVLFTLALGVAGLRIIDYFRNDGLHRLIAIVGVVGVSFLLRCDYGMIGVSFIMLLYLFRNKRDFQFLSAVPAFGHSPYSWSALLAMFPILMYNGKRGFIKGVLGKYLFYIIYPLHLLVLYCLK